MSVAVIKPLKVHTNSSGYLYEVFRCDDPFYSGFGQSYVSAINPGEKKGFHRHFKQTTSIVCVSGIIKLVLIDNTKDDVVVEEHVLDSRTPTLVVISPNIYYGWSCEGREVAILTSVSSHAFYPNNVDGDVVDIDNNPWNYRWGEC